MFVLTVVAQYAFRSHGSRYPVNPSPSTISSMTTPTDPRQLARRLYVPEKKFVTMCRNTMMTIADAPQ